LSQDQVKKFVTGLGITPEYDSTGYINESHSIGGFNGVTPLEMSAAYGAFARGGVYIEPYSFTKIEFLDTDETYTVTPEKRTVMSEATAYMINMILKFAVSNGYVTAGSKSGTDVASKTGTSTVDSQVLKNITILHVNIIGDSWQMVYSPDYVCGVWVGYSKITSTQYLNRYMKVVLLKELS
jgi:penicillin-binding protein 1A